MISERSCDTEDWSNDAENSDLITEIYYILLYIHIQKLFKIVIVHNITVFVFFTVQINAALLNRRVFF